MDTDLSPDNPPGSHNSSDSAFSSWMLVPRRRGRARGRGGSSCPTPVSAGVATKENTPPTVPSGIPSRGTWIGVKSRGRGGTTSPRASYFHYYNTDQILMEDPTVQLSPLVAISGSSPLRNNTSPPRDNTPPTFPDNITTALNVDQVPNSSPIHTQALCSSPPAVLDSPARNPSSSHLGSPPPIIRSSVLSSPYIHSPSSENHHSMAVDNILSALSENLSERSETGTEDDSGESDDAMSDDDGPDDAMTLMQYQNESRRETLIRKGPQVSGSSLKKGRLEVGEPSS